MRTATINIAVEAELLADRVEREFGAGAVDNDWVKAVEGYMAQGFDRTFLVVILNKLDNPNKLIGLMTDYIKLFEEVRDTGDRGLLTKVVTNMLAD